MGPGFTGHIQMCVSPPGAADVQVIYSATPTLSPPHLHSRRPQRRPWCPKLVALKFGTQNLLQTPRCSQHPGLRASSGGWRCRDECSSFVLLLSSLPISTAPDASLLSLPSATRCLYDSWTRRRLCAPGFVVLRNVPDEALSSDDGMEHSTQENVTINLKNSLVVEMSDILQSALRQCCLRQTRNLGGAFLCFLLIVLYDMNTHVENDQSPPSVQRCETLRWNIAFRLRFGSHLEQPAPFLRAACCRAEVCSEIKSVLQACLFSS